VLTLEQKLVRLAANAPERFLPNSKLAQYHWNSSSKEGSRIKSSSKLFGILSLILQAFDCPLTTELEERYVCALQRALEEIQTSARSYSQKSQEQEI